ncbi:mannose-1-phosphate guanylyltransferase/mannose-6-phosphate isomerase [Alcanivorax sp. S6407]|uniref:mannose-1-phosphate guanylyltransferase/mannose-6-phosphate isomerase n=1 Tax=Alcanivorax sp. S6407 TaxID=2926424 RepID=UPI001FF4AC50|nr:mannose-1-phosphate guanylyltransferase/mannose-6-phosphate isomerase [Alcanivorax sp. S6407]MCK0155297.1 mannose-1-phosphate guanylyltransferase/mannose-6-phosphate isomerase [Alcanivorax sp. S6407]
MLIPVIIAGGNGSRLWPLSRSHYPKQLLRLNGEYSMLQATLIRMPADLRAVRPIVVCNQEHRFLVAEQLNDIGIEADILLEPCGRNTAPAVALAALQARQRDTNAKIFVCPADHAIRNPEALETAINAAYQAAEKGLLVTFGIQPDRAETGYGYICMGEAREDHHLIERFVEKPDAATAQQFLDDGGYLWNSGMFLFRAERYLQELREHHPQMLAHCTHSLLQGKADLDFVRLDEASFARCEDLSIDYAIMEHTRDGAVVPVELFWNDLGSWQSLWDHLDKDGDGNHLRGDIIAHGSSNNLAMSDERLVALLGVEDLVVVDTPDAILVAHKSQAQEVKRITDTLKARKRPETEDHRLVHRPWGKYDSVDKGNRYQVKHITVKPGEQLSVQMHHHRAEHWIVVSGTAKVTCGQSTFLVAENQSTFIPIGEVHSLENPGRIPLELIEVQSGTYLGEDDIIRISDRYHREDATEKVAQLP